MTPRICVVGPLPPPAGGMATQTRQLVELLRAEALPIELVRTNAPYRPAWIERVTGLRAIFRLIPYLYHVWKMAGRSDVIHLMANSGWAWQLFAAPVIWLCWLRSTPVIVNYRGGYAREYFKKSFPRVAPSLRKATKIVVPSGYLKAVFAEFGVKTEIIPNIIDPERFRPAQKQKHDGRFKVIITRNLEPIYGIDTALRAIDLVRREIPNVCLEIAGSGPQKHQLESLIADLGLENHVSLVGRLETNQISGFYQSADLMLNPTTVDNMPNSVLESMACGIPVVSTNVGGIPYIVEHEKTALLVNKGDFKDLARQIARVHNDAALRTHLSQNALEQVRQYYWPNVRAQWLKLYRELGTQKTQCSEIAGS